MRRNRLYTAINILGLSFGICACIVIYLICSYEFSFDTFHPDAGRIYRVMGDVKKNTGESLHFGRLPFGLAQSAGSGATGIEAVAGIIPYNAGISIPNGPNPSKHFKNKTVIAQPQYFDIFNYPLTADEILRHCGQRNCNPMSLKRALDELLLVEGDD